MDQTKLLTSSPEDLAQAAKLLAQGGLVAFPTETVYGLGGDARRDDSVARIFEAKGRPRFNPLIVHVPDLQLAEKIAHFDDRARSVAAEFWPGPLTLVLPLKEEAGISPLVTAGLDTVAIRLPAHPVARDLLRAFDGPLAAPSANPSGKISPTRAEHVISGLSGRIAGVVDGGACAVGVESTILGLADQPRLLRAGGVPLEALERLLGAKIALGGDANKPNAPGQLLSHYAPEALVRLNALEAQEGEVLIGFGAIKGKVTLSDSGDLVEAAANLFQMLHQADALAQGGRIAFAPIPEEGLGRAINDRLRRAAAPRP